MEGLVTTLETSKRLKAAGFPQTTFMWETRTVNGEPYKQSVTPWVDEKPYKYERKGDVLPKVVRDSFPAPTAQEIADQLGFGVTVNTVKGGWSVGGLNVVGHWPRCKGYTMAEALAALYLKLRGENRWQGTAE